MKELKCVTLKGDLEDWGKHVLLLSGNTMCGMPTVDTDTDEFIALKDPLMADMISEYIEEDEWEITCEKCLAVFDLIKEAERKRKSENN